ncbi:MAG: hypothetical protein PWQ15_1193 [Methanobacterium sp.]|jgi:succinoglycan biosynthesis protein ExoA|uniref:glycosyltransferase n=1 Tax=Methanobacterium sp. TaxID=2164 RepID=UPI0003C93A55|nr:glycosyltransferase [Methanobacterium sp.]MDI3550091.1 hypothetical protein [Methanobacterium sp.]CDG65031.1 hypothetical protein MBMB1_0929 [Methanobacterium sp. MB1]
MSLIDIIVGVKNEEKYIKKCITSLQNQTIKDINILVVDGLSNDKTREIVCKLKENDPRIKYFINENEIISTARNIGLNASQADYIAYIDGHTFVDKDWLETLYTTFKEYESKCRLGAVGSTYASPEDDTSFGKTVAYCVQTLFGGLGTSFTKETEIHSVETVAFALYKRSTLIKEGISYDEKMTHCEDTDFNHQLIKKGYILLKHPKVLVYQYRRKNIFQFFMQMFKYGEGRYKLAQKYRETLKYYHLIPMIAIFYMLLAFITLILLILNLISLFISILIFLPVFFYLMIDILYTLGIIIRHRRLNHASAILIFPAIHIGYGIGFLKGFILT